LAEAREYTQELEVQRDSSDRHAAGLNQERIGLEAKLQQAEQERDGYAGDAAILRNLNKQAGDDIRKLEAERDAAIKRGVQAYRCAQRHIDAFFAEILRQRTRAEAAERRVRELEARTGPQVVCLCGSTRFMDAFNEVGWQKTLDGEIVLSVGVSKYLPDDHGGEWCGPEVAAALDELHKRKIDLADYVYVLNVGGYIGNSTRSEIEYAKTLGKRVDYLEPPAEAEEGRGE
jgi:hypothetical protein